MNLLPFLLIAVVVAVIAVIGMKTGASWGQKTLLLALFFLGMVIFSQNVGSAILLTLLALLLSPLIQKFAAKKQATPPAESDDVTDDQSN